MSVKPVFGAMTIGDAGNMGVRISDMDTFKGLLDAFSSKGYDEIDTARMYGGGSTEKWLAMAGYQERGLKVDTKIYPSKSSGIGMSIQSWSHSAEDIRDGLATSLEALQTDKIQTYYLHAPDRKTPFEETLREINNQYKAGKFERFGLSNFQAWEVARMCEIARQNDWVQPTVYQGLYNAFQRAAEAELFPCLKYYGISFSVWGPLAGGFLTGRYKRDTTEVEKGGRYDPTNIQGQRFRQRFWNDENFGALEMLTPVAEKHGLAIPECALRWLVHHSGLKGERGDKVIIGASSRGHLDNNLEYMERGPLPQEVLDVLDAGWRLTKSLPNEYWL